MEAGEIDGRAAEAVGLEGRGAVPQQQPRHELRLLGRAERQEVERRVLLRARGVGERAVRQQELRDLKTGSA